MCRLPCNLRASTSWNPQGLSRDCFTFGLKAFIKSVTTHFPRNWQFTTQLYTAVCTTVFLRRLYGLRYCKTRRKSRLVGNLHVSSPDRSKYDLLVLKPPTFSARTKQIIFRVEMTQNKNDFLKFFQNFQHFFSTHVAHSALTSCRRNPIRWIESIRN